MRVYLTGWTLEQVQPALEALERRLRHLFFQGGRRIGLTAVQHEALLRTGVPGLLESEALTGEAWVDLAARLGVDH